MDLSTSRCINVVRLVSLSLYDFYNFGVINMKYISSLYASLGIAGSARE
jgi:hypothetical protein